MSNLRIAIFSLVAFSIPASLGYVAVQYFFSDTVDFISHSDENSLETTEPGKARPKVINVGKGAAFARIQHDQYLDPITGKGMLLSFLVRFEELPSEGYRHNLLAKYADKMPPHPGWAVSVHRIANSFRPEVYWRDESGQGGWLTFDRVSLIANKWYAFSVVVHPQESISMFIQGFAAPSNADGLLAFQTDGKVQFVGGHDISDIKSTMTESDMTLGATRSGPTSFHGEVANVFIGSAQSAPRDASEFPKFLDGGPSFLASRFDASEIFLWVSSKGTDESRFKREIKLSGRASWQTSL